MPARLATLEEDGFPRVTPIWFLWEDGVFVMTSLPHQPHVKNLERDARAAICVDIEERETVEGIRSNRQVKGHGLAQVRPDESGDWTRRITRKYVRGRDGEAAAERRAAMPRVVIELRPERLLTAATRT